jgi:predicted dehydrogenase
MQWWLGPIASVTADIHTFVGERRLPDSQEFASVTSDDYCSLLLRFASGALGTCVITSVARQPEGTRFEIHGTRGSLILDAKERLWGRQAEDKELTELTVADPNWDLPGIEKSVWAVSFIRLAQEMVASIRAGRLPAHGATFRDGARCQAVLDAARESAKNARWAPVPSV